jgi:hypothetical protein
VTPRRCARPVFARPLPLASPAAHPRPPARPPHLFSPHPETPGPPQAERPLGGDDAVRFFTVDGRPPALAEDWRLFRAQMVAAEQRGAAPDAGLSTRVRPKDAWAHLISSPEQGCLLVARQPDLGMFSHSVLLVSEHGALATLSDLTRTLPPATRPPPTPATQTLRPLPPSRSHPFPLPHTISPRPAPPQRTPRARAP